MSKNRAVGSAATGGRRRLLAGVVAGLLVVGGAGAAFAYWSTTGSGTGTAATAAGTANLVIAQTAAPTNLAPGVPASTISGTVTNNATNAAFVTTVTVAITSVTKATGAPAGTCDATDYTLTGAAMAVGVNIAPGASAPFTGATLGFNNKASANQDGCKGATVTLGYTAS